MKFYAISLKHVEKDRVFCAANIIDDEVYVKNWIYLHVGKGEPPIVVSPIFQPEIMYLNNQKNKRKTFCIDTIIEIRKEFYERLNLLLSPAGPSVL